MLEETRSRLTRWASWVRSSGIGMGYTCVRMDSVFGDDVPDAEALQVDRAVARLKLREPSLGKVLMRYYVGGWDYQQVGIEMGVSREKIRGLLRSAEAWVDAALQHGEEARYAAG